MFSFPLPYYAHYLSASQVQDTLKWISLLLSGLCPVPEARAIVEARAIAEARKRKAGLQVKRIKVGAAAGVQRNPETKAKINLRALSITVMRKQRAGAAARKRAGAGVRTGKR